MGFRDWLGRRLGFGAVEEEGVKYVLKRQKDDGPGMAKVMDLAGPTPLEDLYRHLEPGIYALHKYMKGQSGFTTVWGPMQVLGDKPEGAVQPRSAKGGSALETFTGFAKEMAQLKTEAEEEFKILAPLFGMWGTAGQPKTFIEQMDEAKEHYDTLGRFFGEKTSGDVPITYEGTVPIIFHPKLIPELLDTSLEKIEKRLKKWGVVDDETDKREPEDDLPEFPKKPPPASPPDEPDVEIETEEVGEVEKAEEGVEKVEETEEE